MTIIFTFLLRDAFAPTAPVAAAPPAIVASFPILNDELHVYRYLDQNHDDDDDHYSFYHHYYHHFHNYRPQDDD